jgi:hypothetical protein
MPRRTLTATSALAAALLVATAPAGAAGPLAPPAVCNANASLLGFTDSLDKTTFDGTGVGGLSALALTAGTAGGATARALVDNQGTTQARVYDLEIDDGHGTAAVTGITRLRHQGGTPFTGQDLDGEGLVQLHNGTFLASSETEPAIRKFSADGRELGKLPVPERFRIKPAGEATTNLAFEGLGISADGHTLWAGMEGPLTPDGLTADGAARLRFLRYHRTGTAWSLAGQVGYVADPGLAVSELQVVGPDQLLVLERGFTAGVGNTVRVYQAFLTGADDVSGEATLGRDGIRLVTKKLLVDLGDCPPSGATNPGAQANPLLDNIEGMALGRHLGNGQRELRLISDDNFSTGEVTRLYRLSVRLRPEATLQARATYRASELQPGPPSGQTGVGANNGQVPPFAGQPVPGISGALRAANGSFWGMPDNGFGSQGNSGDFLLRMYHVIPRWKTAAGGAGQLVLDRFISLRDPDRKIPFPITNDATADRLLTGDDFDLESVQRGFDGTLWFGEEFGPYLLHTDATGKVLHAPFPLAGVRAPQSHEPGEQTVRSSRGWEAIAASSDGQRLYAIPEVALLTDTDKTLRHVYEFDTTRERWTGRTWTFHAAGDELQIGDAQIIPGKRILFIERDDLEGPAAAVKDLETIDLDGPRAADGSLPETKVLDLLRIRDPFLISGWSELGFGLGDPFSFALQSVETVLPFGDGKLLVANDNNYPDSNGRVPGTPDDLEAILIGVQGLG